MGQYISKYSTVTLPWRDSWSIQTAKAASWNPSYARILTLLMTEFRDVLGGMLSSCVSKGFGGRLIKQLVANRSVSIFCKIVFIFIIYYDEYQGSIIHVTILLGIQCLPTNQVYIIKEISHSSPSVLILQLWAVIFHQTWFGINVCVFLKCILLMPYYDGTWMWDPWEVVRSWGWSLNAECL